MELPLASLLRVCRQLEGSWQLSEILAAVAPVVDTELGYPHTFLTLFQEPPGFATVISHVAAEGNPVGGSQELLAKFQSLEIPIAGDAMLEEILASDHIVVVEDARTDPRTNKAIVEALQNRTLINVPLTLAGKRLGALGLSTFTDAEGVRPPQPWHLEYLGLLAGHVAAALDRVRIAEFRARTEAEKLRALIDLAGQVAHELNNPLGAILSCVRSAEGHLRTESPSLEEAYLEATPEMRAAYRRLRDTAADRPARPAARGRSPWAQRWAEAGIQGPPDFAEGLEAIGFPLDWPEGWGWLDDPRFARLIGHLVARVEHGTLLSLISQSADRATESVRRLSLVQAPAFQ